MKKKLLSVFLSLALCFSVMPETVYATETGVETGSGECGHETDIGYVEEQADGSYECTGCGRTMSIVVESKNSDNSFETVGYYTNLQKAVNAVVDGGKIRLLQDVALNGDVTVNRPDANVYLYLNKHKLTLGDSDFRITGGNVEFRDTSDDNGGASVAGGGAVVSGGEGKLVVATGQNGGIEQTASETAASLENVNILVQSGKLILYSGTFSEITQTGGQVFVNGGTVTKLTQNDGSATMNGGTVTKLTQNDGSATMNGGTVTKLTQNDGNATMNGGTAGTWEVKDGYACVDCGTVENLTQSGGTLKLFSTEGNADTSVGALKVTGGSISIQNGKENYTSKIGSIDFTGSDNTIGGVLDGAGYWFKDKDGSWVDANVRKQTCLSGNGPYTLAATPFTGTEIQLRYYGNFNSTASVSELEQNPEVFTASFRGSPYSSEVSYRWYIDDQEQTGETSETFTPENWEIRWNADATEEVSHIIRCDMTYGDYTEQAECEFTVLRNSLIGTTILYAGTQTPSVTYRSDGRSFSKDDFYVFFKSNKLVNSENFELYLRDAEGKDSGDGKTVTVTDSGTYQLVFKAVGNVYRGEKSVRLTVNPQEISADDITLTLDGCVTEAVYSGNAFEPAVECLWSDGDSAAVLLPESEYTVGYTDNKDAGTATVTVTNKEGGNYTINGSATRTFTIQKAALTGAAVSMESYAYADTPSVPAVAGVPEEAVVEYYYNTESSNENGTKWEDMTGESLSVGTYYLYAQLSEMKNYTDFTTDPVSFTVTRAAAPVSEWPVIREIYVNDTLTDADMTGGSSALSGSFALTGAKSWTTGGEKTTAVTFTPEDSTNYTSVVNKAISVNVKKRIVKSVAEQAAVTEKLYGTAQSGLGLPETVSFTTVDGKTFENIPVVWSGYDAETLAKQRLTGTLDLSAVADEVEQPAEEVTASISVTLSALTADTPVFTEKTVTYNGFAQAHAISAVPAGVRSVTYMYEGTDGTVYAKSGNAPVNAGRYTVTASFGMENGYAQFAAVTALLTIERASVVSASVSMADYTYGGTPSVPSVMGNTGNGAVTYYWSTANVNENGTKWENMAGTTLAAGTYYLYAEIAETENYEGSVTACTAFCVKEAGSDDAGSTTPGTGDGSGDAETGEGGNAGSGDAGSTTPGTGDGSGDAETGEGGNAGSDDAGSTTPGTGDGSGDAETGEGGNAGSGDAGSESGTGSGSAGTVSGNGSGNESGTGSESGTGNSGNAGNESGTGSGSTGNESGTGNSGNAGNDNGNNNTGRGLNVNGGTMESVSRDWQNVDTFLQGLIQSADAFLTVSGEGQESGADGTDAENGVNVNIHVFGEAEIPGSVLQTISGTTFTLAMQQGNGVALSISGGALNEDNLSGIQTIDLTADTDAATIPAELTQERETGNSRQLAIRDTGRFAVPVGLHVGMGAENAGRYANFYRYNEAAGRLEYCGSFRITENGQAMLALQQGGSYFVNVTDEVPEERYHFQAVSEDYTVQSGDTLSRIARRFRMSLAELLKKNPDLADPNSIRAGQRINVN